LITCLPFGSWILAVADPLDQLRRPQDAVIGDRV